jgi:hypothetical protein
LPLARRAVKPIKNFSTSVSYRVGEARERLRDALNVYSNQGRLETRFGYSRFNATSLGGPVLSASFFKDVDSASYRLAKVGAAIYKVNAVGAATSLKTGLTATTKYRAVTMNDRHILAIESDGLYSYNGVSFTALGQAPPASYSAAIAAGGSLTTANTYQVGVTYYSSDYGFESNALKSSIITATTPNLQIDLSAMPNTATNAFIDKKRIYLKNVTDEGPFLFIAEIALTATTYSITAESQSSFEMPTENAVFTAGGAKFLAIFNGRLVAAGNSEFKNDIFFSEEDQPDCFNDTATALRLNAPGNGPITGLAVGQYNESVLDPFLVVFKNRSTHIYSEIGGQGRFTPINLEIGCVSHDTITVKDGVVYFLSEKGWRAIKNGRMLTTESGKVGTLGMGDIDDIFTSKGFVFEINRTTLDDTFAVYYPTLDQYITWVGEGTNSAFSKAYVYEHEVGGFKPYQFALSFTCACLGEDSTGREALLLGDSNGYLYCHSIHEARSDRDSANAETAIDAFAQLFWTPMDGDYDASYNFRELIVRGITSSNAITVKTWVNFDISDLRDYSYSFPDPSSGAIWDESYWDEGIWSDERAIVTARADINRVGETILIGFYQNIVGANMNLVSAQLNYSKNGNRNV